MVFFKPIDVSQIFTFSTVLLVFGLLGWFLGWILPLIDEGDGLLLSFTISAALTKIYPN